MHLLRFHQDKLGTHITSEKHMCLRCLCMYNSFSFLSEYIIGCHLIHRCFCIWWTGHWTFTSGSPPVWLWARSGSILQTLASLPSHWEANYLFPGSLIKYKITRGKREMKHQCCFTRALVRFLRFGTSSSISSTSSSWGKSPTSNFCGWNMERDRST